MDIPLTNQRNESPMILGRITNFFRRIINSDPELTIRVAMILNFVVSIAFVTVSRQIFSNSEFFIFHF